jgi:uncharacterized membrane protein
MKHLVFAMILLWLGTLPAVSGAHERHQHHPARPAAGAARDSSGAAAAPYSGPAATVGGPPAAGSKPYEVPPLLDAVRRHPHNKIVHFPIVLSLVSLAGLWLGRDNPGLLRFARGCAWAAALAAGAAWIAGLSQMSAFDGEPKAWLVLTHRNWGIASTAALAATALVAQWPRTRSRAWIAGLVAALIVGVTGFLGGLLSHG